MVARWPQRPDCPGRLSPACHSSPHNFSCLTKRVKVVLAIWVAHDPMDLARAVLWSMAVQRPVIPLTRWRTMGGCMYCASPLTRGVRAPGPGCKRPGPGCKRPAAGGYCSACLPRLWWLPPPPRSHFLCTVHLAGSLPDPPPQSAPCTSKCTMRNFKCPDRFSHPLAGPSGVWRKYRSVHTCTGEAGVPCTPRMELGWQVSL